MVLVLLLGVPRILGMGHPLIAWGVQGLSLPQPYTVLVQTLSWRHSVLAVGDGASTCSVVGCLYAHLQWPAPHSEEGRDLVLALEPRDQCRASSCQLPTHPAHEPRACVCPGLNQPQRFQAGASSPLGCTSWPPSAALCLAGCAGWPRPEQPWQRPWAEGAEEAQGPACSLPSLRTVGSSVPWFALGAQRALVLTRTVSVSPGPLGGLGQLSPVPSLLGP